jgi:hypothetical protein
LLTELSPKHRDIAAIYTGLGSTIAKAQTNPRRALRYLRQSLTLQIMLPKTKKIIDTTLTQLFTLTLKYIANQ